MRLLQVTALAVCIGLSLIGSIAHAKSRSHAKAPTTSTAVTYLPARTATPDELEKIRASMKLKLKDDEGARYANVEVAERVGGNGSAQICGLVNAKNSYGAYAGYSAFNAAWMTFPQESGLKSEMLILSMDEPVVRRACRDYGIALP